MSRITPAEKIAVLKDLGSQKTKSGLELPTQDERAKPELGIIIEVGAGKQPVPMKKGDKVVFRKYMENKIPIDAELYNFIDFKDILAVISE